MRKLFNFLLLLAIWIGSRIFYRFDFEWLEPLPEVPWGRYRVLAILNHTSLFEWLYAGGVPIRFLWYIAGHALVPVADKTLRRPFVGRFFKILIPRTVPITRQADRTWSTVLDKIGDDVMVIILPEGRMKRADGLDKDGRPMTVRGGIADILQAIPDGKMLITYSRGLHHVQVPGQTFPKLFKTLRMKLQEVDIASYKAQFQTSADPQDFKPRIKRDLEARRDRYCPVGREI